MTKTAGDKAVQAKAAKGLEPEVYVQLIRQLFGTKVSFFASTAGSLVVGYVAWDRAHDPVFLWLFLPLLAASLARFVVLIRHERNAYGPDDVASARRWERLYASTTLVWSSVFGLTSCLAMLKDDPVLHIYVTFLLIAFAGGMAGRNASRPLIVYGQVLTVIVPYAAGLLMNGHEYYAGLMLLVLLQVVSVRGMTAHIYGILNAALTSALRSKTLATRFEGALNNMSHGLCMTDADGAVVVSNGRLVEILGVDASAVVAGGPLVAAISGARPDDTVQGLRFDALAAGLARGEAVTASVPLKSGRVVEFRARPMAGGGTVVLVEDVTEREAAARKIERMAHYDELTGLPNRALFKEEMERAFEALRSDGHGFAVLSLDLDEFKEINDTLGHPMGDRLLKQVADRMRRESGPGDVMARFGGDEFFVLHRPANSEDETVCLAERLVKAISVPYVIDGHNMNVGVSIGIARGGIHGEGVDDILRNVDQALYRSKNEGRRTYCMFRPEMNLEAQKRRLMEIDLRKAIDDEALTVFFQPIVDVAKGKVTCFEALVRWRRETGMVSPGEFIPLAEQTGLIVDLGGLVLRKACMEAASWPTGIRVAVNLSAVQFQHNAVIRQVTEALLVSGLPAHRLEVEITESLALKDMGRTIEVIETLRRMGVRIALDDFGTGETSLSYLDKIPFDKVKVDRSFVTTLTPTSRSARIIEFLTKDVADSDATVVVEGVETQEELKILRDLGVCEIQGFLLSKPRPAAEFDDMLASVAKALPQPLQANRTARAA